MSRDIEYKLMLSENKGPIGSFRCRAPTLPREGESIFYKDSQEGEPLPYIVTSVQHMLAGSGARGQNRKTDEIVVNAKLDEFFDKA